MAADIMYTIHFYVLFVLSTLRCSSSFIGNGENYRRNLSLELNPGLNSSLTPLPPGVGLLHVRALGKNNTLHYLLCSQGAPALLLVHTNSTSSKVKVDWPAFLVQNTTGSLKLTPESSVLYSNALVFTRLWEYDDVNDTAVPEHLPPSSFFQPYELQNFTWDDLNKTLDPMAHTALLCGRGASESFSNGSLCLKFSAFGVEGRDQGWPSLLHNANSSQLRVVLDGVVPRSNRSRFSLELQVVGGTQAMSRVDVLQSIDKIDWDTSFIQKVKQYDEKAMIDNISIKHSELLTLSNINDNIIINDRLIVNKNLQKFYCESNKDLNANCFIKVDSEVQEYICESQISFAYVSNSKHISNNLVQIDIKKFPRFLMDHQDVEQNFEIEKRRTSVLIYLKSIDDYYKFLTKYALYEPLSYKPNYFNFMYQWFNEDEIKNFYAWNNCRDIIIEILPGKDYTFETPDNILNASCCISTLTYDKYSHKTFENKELFDSIAKNEVVNLDLDQCIVNKSTKILYVMVKVKNSQEFYKILFSNNKNTSIYAHSFWNFNDKNVPVVNEFYISNLPEDIKMETLQDFLKDINYYEIKLDDLQRRALIYLKSEEEVKKLIEKNFLPFLDKNIIIHQNETSINDNIKSNWVRLDMKYTEASSMNDVMEWLNPIKPCKVELLKDLLFVQVLNEDIKDLWYRNGKKDKHHNPIYLNYASEKMIRDLNSNYTK